MDNETLADIEDLEFLADELEFTCLEDAELIGQYYSEELD